MSSKVFGHLQESSEMFMPSSKNPGSPRIKLSCLYSVTQKKLAGIGKGEYDFELSALIQLFFTSS